MNEINFTYELNNGYWIDVNITNDKVYTLTKDGVSFIMPEEERSDFKDVCEVIINLDRNMQ